MQSRIGLSYSSTRTTARWPLLVAHMGNQFLKPASVIRKLCVQTKVLFQHGELLVQTLPQISHRAKRTATKADADHRVFLR